MKILSPSTIGCIAHYVTQCLIKTLRVQMIMDPKFDPKAQYVYGFWHDKHLVPVMLVSRYSEKYTGLVSASRDGDMLTAWLTRLGYDIIRGSSSRKALSGFLKLLKAIKQGYNVGIAADGPRGPAHQAKSGAAFLAYKSGLPFVALGVATSSKWCFHKSWDKYELPKPFARTVLYFGEPVWITDLSDQEQADRIISDAIDKADENAKKVLMGEVSEQPIHYPV